VWEHPEFGPDVVNPATEPPAPIVKEKLYHLVLQHPGVNKISTLKAIRTITNMSLVNAKKLTDNIPSRIMEYVSYDTVAIGYNHMQNIAPVTVVEATTGVVTVADEPPEVIVTWPEQAQASPKKFEMFTYEPEKASTGVVTVNVHTPQWLIAQGLSQNVQPSKSAQQDEFDSDFSCSC